MFDRFRLKEVLVEYKKDFVPKQWGDEKYKWEAVKHFPGQLGRERARLRRHARAVAGQDR